MSKQVDIICGSYPPMACGVADYTRQLVKALQGQNVSARVITTEGADVNADPEVSALALAEDWTPEAAKALSVKLSSSASNIVHIQFPTPVYHGKWGISFLPWYLKKQGKRVVITLHEYCMAPRGGRLKQIVAGRFSDEVILTNDYDRGLIGRWKSAGKLNVIPIGSNIRVTGTKDNGLEIFKSIGCPDRKPSALFFGFVRPGKGLETVLQALKGLDASLVIVSPAVDPDYRSLLDKMAEDLNVSQQVFWAGYRTETDVSSLILASSAITLPFEDGATERRGSLLAGITHGSLVVTTSGPMTPEIFQNGENMLMSPVGDSSSFTDNLRLALEDTSKAATIRENALRLGERYSWKSIAGEHLRVYSKLESDITGSGG